jgi:hypothetical protein
MKYDSAKYLFLKIVQKANASEFSPRRLAEFVQEKESKIQRVGTVLQFLGLAERSENGWAANHRLMSIIAKQLARRSHQNGKVKVTDDDRGFLMWIYYEATGINVGDYYYGDDGYYDYDDDEEEEEERYAANWCWNVLAALGLIKKREGKHWGFKPTRRLKRLFESVPVVKEQIEQIKRVSAQSANISYLNTTGDAEVSDKSSSPGVVVNETPLEPSPSPGVASASSIEGTAPTPGSSVHILRARVIAKPVLGLTTPLTRRATVPVPPVYSKRAGGRPFGSAAGEQAGEQRGRLAIPAFRGHPVKVQPTKLAAKLPEVRSRKVQDKKAKRPSRDDLSDCW